MNSGAPASQGFAGGSSEGREAFDLEIRSPDQSLPLMREPAGHTYAARATADAAPAVAFVVLASLVSVRSFLSPRV